MKVLWSKEKAWKDMRKYTDELTKGKPVEGFIVSCMWFCMISSVHLGIFSSVSSLLDRCILSFLSTLVQQLWTAFKQLLPKVKAAIVKWKNESSMPA